MDYKKIAEAIRLRIEYDKAIADRWMETDPIDVVSVAAGKWLAAEDGLTAMEYQKYQSGYALHRAVHGREEERHG
jgi:hypothetical protein